MKSRGRKMEVKEKHILAFPQIHRKNKLRRGKEEVRGGERGGERGERIV